MMDGANHQNIDDNFQKRKFETIVKSRKGGGGGGGFYFTNPDP